MKDTDAAQIAFFANYYIFAHEAYEQALMHYKQPLSYWLTRSNIKLPIIQSQAQYKMPITLGDPLSICLSVLRIGHTSFHLHYEFYKEIFQAKPTTKAVAAVQTVHVAVQNKSSVTLPPHLIEVLEKIKTHHTEEYSPQMSHLFSTEART
jgi:YbgC/YbaW family acyl-CoA thioester hydrolase